MAIRYEIHQLNKRIAEINFHPRFMVAVCLYRVQHAMANPLRNVNDFLWRVSVLVYCRTDENDVGVHRPSSRCKDSVETARRIAIMSARTLKREGRRRIIRHIEQAEEALFGAKDAQSQLAWTL